MHSGAASLRTNSSHWGLERSRARVCSVRGLTGNPGSLSSATEYHPVSRTWGISINGRCFTPTFFPGFLVRWLCIINNNKPAQSEAIIESLLSADINGIPSSELLCGYLIGRHVGGSQPDYAIIWGTPTDVRSAPWRGSGCYFPPLRDYCRKVKVQGPSRSAWRLEKQRNLGRREMILQTNTVAPISDLILFRSWCLLDCVCVGEWFIKKGEEPWEHHNLYKVQKNKRLGA